MELITFIRDARSVLNNGRRVTLGRCETIIRKALWEQLVREGRSLVEGFQDRMVGTLRSESKLFCRSLMEQVKAGVRELSSFVAFNVPGMNTDINPAFAGCMHSILQVCGDQENLDVSIRKSDSM